MFELLKCADAMGETTKVWRALCAELHGCRCMCIRMCVSGHCQSCDSTVIIP